MGLAEPRKRMKLSHDPNNTKWTRDTGGFGHKIMTSQGWQPGDYLGVKDAAHAEFHTAANASHIRVIVKDDNLGLGAKRGSGLAQGECTGLDAFQALLGRLNGKDDEVLQREQKSREDLKRAIYSERKWGSVRFVKGGFLIGDKIQKLVDDEAKRIRILEGEVLSLDDEPSEEEEQPEIKQVKTPEKDENESPADDAVETDAIDPPEVRRRKRKLEKKHKKAVDVEHHLELEAKERRKADRKEKRKKKAEEELSAAVDDSERTKKKSRKNRHSSTPDTKRSRSGVDLSGLVSSEDVSDPPRSPPLHFAGNRHAVRARFIAHKKLAVMNSAALDQIFMIKRPQTS